MFKYYTEERGTFQFPDYRLLMNEVKIVGAKSCLEFGPGISTWALIEAGVEHIVTLEHDDEWFEKAKETFKDFPQVMVRRYQDEPEAIGDLSEGETFDMAFVDSPKGFTHQVKGVRGVRKRHPGQEDCSRFNTCVLALKHAPVVYLHDANRPLELGTLGRLHAMGHKITRLHTKVGMARIDRNGENKDGPSS